MAKPVQEKSTQSYLRLSEVKLDTILTDDGKFCAVIAVSSTNFALKSQEEQDALIYGYQNLLNSLDFTIQILMQSRKMDVHVYLEKVHKVMEQQTNELLRVQTAEYIEFISRLIENASIMNKNFYVIVPFTPAVLDSGNKVGGLFKFLKKPNPTGAVSERFKNFQDQKLKLDQRVNTVISGLSGLGLKCIALKTPEITELLYNSYNIDSGPLIDANNLENIQLTPQK